MPARPVRLSFTHPACLPFYPADLTTLFFSIYAQVEKFSSYFFDAPIFSIPGRTHKVRVVWFSWNRRAASVGVS